MKIATWNVNSVRSRLPRLTAWLQKVQPDVVCLQETKVTDDVFPFGPIREAGYRAAVHGQKTYNGVAILSRSEPINIQWGMGDGVEACNDPSVTSLTHPAASGFKSATLFGRYAGPGRATFFDRRLHTDGGCAAGLDFEMMQTP